ncbi:MAG TPA: EAL domain-containing protein, partial [Cellvibrionaceae bacterium]
QADRLHNAIHNATFGAAFDIELSLDQQKPKRWIRIIGKPAITGIEPFAVLGSVQDISERKRFTNKIQQQAIYDQLTGLPNRLLLDNRLSKAINKATRDKAHQVAILFIDLDNFKPVNDNMGHQAGDTLLREVSTRIRQAIRSSDTVGRYSGDEFIVVLEEITSSKTAVAVAEHILDVLKEPYTIHQKQLFCSASIGISLFPDDGNTADILISNADQAMYEVKRSGRNGWQFFTKSLQQVSEKRHLLGTQLISAINNQEFQVFYQPIIDLTNNRVRKCEALVRWFCDGKLVPTDEFISLAEETGRINDIDRFVLATASEFLISLQKQYNYTVGLSVNVSPRVFSTKDNSLERWLELMTRAASQLPLTVEITERLLIEESDRLMWVLTKLKALGVSIAIDDFGTGYSSLSYLTRFPIDVVKIDQSFIKKLGLEHAPEALTETMIDLSHKLSIEVVAEGVETPGQLEYLKRWHCDYGQGYLFDKPLDAEHFSQLIAKQAREKPNEI